MLTIRRSQMEALREAPRAVFENQMIAHLAKFAPRHCEVIGEPAVREAIRLGITRARNYGLANRGPVRFYIESMFMFGSDFDTDPQAPWAMKVLNDPRVDQMAKSERLYADAMDYVSTTAGPDYEYAKEALRKVRDEDFEAYPVLDDQFADEMMARLRRIHPQKIQYLGEATIRTLIGLGAELAGRLSLAPRRGAALCVGAMFALGHGFSHDPLLPWISRTITNAAITDPEVRVKRLHSRIMTYLDRVLANQEAGENREPDRLL